MNQKPVFLIIDSPMGTGKSTWLIKSILMKKPRAVIVLPIIQEVRRYEKALESIEGLVSIRGKADGETSEEYSQRPLGNLGITLSDSLTSQFRKALCDAQIILITHALYEKYLTLDTFDIIGEGEWSLIMDEVVNVFEPVKLVTSTDIAGLISKDVLVPRQISDQIARLEVNPKTLCWYLNLPATDASNAQKKMIREASLKDVLAVYEEQGAIGFPTFTLKEERLNAFSEVTILTYPFKNTDLEYWLKIKGYRVDHRKLTRVSSTDSLDDFRLISHDGIYSGAEFRDRIELVGIKRLGKGEVYGSKPNHFSVTEYKVRMTGNAGKLKSHLDPIRRTIRREFRYRRDEARWCEPDDFMFTCPKDAINLWKDPKNGLPGTFLGETTWVPFNKRATNEYSHKHNLAFLYNVYPFAEVKKIVEAFGLSYDWNQYALYFLIQWIWRSAIRRPGEKIRLYLPSERMRRIFETWLNGPME